MNPNLRFVRVSEENIERLAEGISELHLAAFGKRFDRDYWRWRYLEGPVGRGNLIVALRGDKVVGKYGLTYLPLIAGGKETMGGLMEISIHPQERSWQCYKGLVRASIAESQNDKLAFRFGIISSRLVEMNRRLGVLVLGRIPFYIGVINVAKLLEGCYVSYPLSLSGWLAQPFLGLRIKKKDNYGLDIRSVEQFDSSFDELWNTIAKNRNISVIKNAKYLNWRYVRCPSRKYRRLVAYRDKRMDGFIIFCATDPRHKSFMFELMARNDDSLVMKALISQMLKELKNEDKSHVLASFPAESPVAFVMKEAGFKSWGTMLWPMYAVVALESSREMYQNTTLKNWDFSLGEWMVY